MTLTSRREGTPIAVCDLPPETRTPLGCGDHDPRVFQLRSAFFPQVKVEGVCSQALIGYYLFTPEQPYPVIIPGGFRAGAIGRVQWPGNHTSSEHKNRHNRT